MQLKSRRIVLGDRGLEVSQLCFGTEHIIHYTPEEGGRLLAQAAHEYGVTFWDTAPVYDSHPHVAAGLKQAGRKNIQVTSKIQARTRQEAQQALDAILKELDIDYLDICLLHYVKTGELPLQEEALDYLQQAKAEGKVRASGLSAHSPSVIAEASRLSGIDVVCGTFNRSSHWVEDGTLEEMGAALKGAYEAGKGVYVIKVLGLGEELPDVQGAIEFALEKPFIHVYNIGMKDVGELEENLGIINHYSR